MRALAVTLLLTLAPSTRAELPPWERDPTPATPGNDTATDDRLTALERRVAELCERLDRPAPLLDKHPLPSNGLEVQTAPPTAYAAACGPNGCGLASATYSTTWPVGGPFMPTGAYFSGPAGYSTTGGSCAGGSCGATAPASGFLRGGLFRGRR
jgi:hypothetical protein